VIVAVDGLRRRDIRFLDTFSAMTLRGEKIRGAFSTASALCLGAIALSACGGGSQQVDLTSARGCLADAGYERVVAADVGASLPGSVAPNLAMVRADLTVEATVNGNVARAERRLADLRGVLEGLGVSEPEKRVSRVGNAVIVFTPQPSDEERVQALGCFRQT
jgi:hypothetical protein